MKQIAQNILPLISFLSISICTLLVIPQTTNAQNLAYGAYDLFAKGAINVVGSGGAFTALSNNSNATIFNPAGMVFSNWKFDFQGSNIQISNQDQTSTGTLSNATSYSVQFYSTAYKPSKKFALAIGLSAPFNLTIENPFNDNKNIIRLISADISLAWKFLDNLSFGVTGHYEFSDLQFNDGTFNEKTSSNVIYPTVGLSYNNKKFSFGASYTQKRSHEIDEQLNNNIGSNIWFRDIDIPDKLSFGLSYLLKNNTRLSVDLNIYGKQDNSILPGTGLFDDINVEKIISESVSTIHLGATHQFIKQKSIEVNFQLGGYLEPSRLVINNSRYHITFGADVRFGPLVLAVAYDQAKEFESTSAGFSLSMGNL